MNNKLTLFALLLTSPVASFAQANSVDDLKQLLKTQDYQQAYQLSQTLVDEFGGESDFDFLAGLAAFGSEHYQEAVFAFERVVLVNPSSFNGRYYLSLCYKQLDNFAAAINELTKLSNNKLTLEQREKVNAQLRIVNNQLVDLKRSFKQSIGLTLGLDSNINGGSSVDEVHLPNGTIIPLLDTSKDINDISYAARYQANYKHSLNQYQALEADFSFHYLDYDTNSDFKRESYNFTLKYHHQVDDDTSWNIGLSTAPLFFGNDKYRTQQSLLFGWKQQADRKNSYGINASFSEIDYDQYETLGLIRYQLNAFYTYKTQIQQTFMLNWYVDENQEGLRHNDRTVLGANYSLSYAFSNNLIGSGMVGYEQQTYEDKNPLFGDVSDAKVYSLVTQLVYKGFNHHQLLWQLSYQDKQIDSNINAMKIYEYDRTEASFTWQYAF